MTWATRALFRSYLFWSMPKWMHFNLLFIFNSIFFPFLLSILHEIYFVFVFKLQLCCNELAKYAIELQKSNQNPISVRRWNARMKIRNKNKAKIKSRFSFAEPSKWTIVRCFIMTTKQLLLPILMFSVSLCIVIQSSGNNKSKKKRKNNWQTTKSIHSNLLLFML